jgi:hypothetical protein
MARRSVRPLAGGCRCRHQGRQPVRKGHSILSAELCSKALAIKHLSLHRRTSSLEFYWHKLGTASVTGSARTEWPKTQGSHVRMIDAVVQIANNRRQGSYP